MNISINRYYFINIIVYRYPAVDDEQWPLYTKATPDYYIFNAEGGGSDSERKKSDKTGKGPMSTACAFWNTFLPKFRILAGKCVLYFHSIEFL